MSTFATSMDIEAPAKRVWSVMSDVERWPEWTPSVRRVRRVDSGPLRAGSRAWVRQPNLPPALWKVTELVEGSGFTWVTRSPGVLVTARHEVAPTERGTRATLSIAYSGALAFVVVWLTRSINDRYLAMEAAGLKRRSEEHAAA
jgi:hypothetical protein